MFGNDFTAKAEPKKSNLDFYMVFLEGCSTPAYKHPDQASAENEAKRLARIHNKKAFVLKPVKSVEVSFKEEARFDLNMKINVDHRKIQEELDDLMAIISLMSLLEPPKSAKGFL